MFQSDVVEKLVEFLSNFIRITSGKFPLVCIKCSRGFVVCQFRIFTCNSPMLFEAPSNCSIAMTAVWSIIVLWSVNMAVG